MTTTTAAFLVALSAGLYGLAFAPLPGAWVAAWVAFAPFFAAAASTTPPRAFALGLLFGVASGQALGNTTNLAARLQAMSRELVASVVIDAATRERAKEVAADFIDQGELPVRGRTQGQRAFALPLSA